MAYDLNLTDRVRETLQHLPDVEEKQMFSGMCFMVNGKMCVGVSHDDLMCRVGPDNLVTALDRGARQMTMKDKVMKDYVYVEPHDLRSRQNLEFWVNLALEFNPKAKSSKKK